MAPKSCRLGRADSVLDALEGSGGIYERRAETHERFYMIEVHRHRFARHARKVPFEKGTCN